MCDGVRRNLGAALGLGEDEGALQDGLGVQGEGLHGDVLHAIGFDGKDYKLKGPITLWR